MHTPKSIESFLIQSKHGYRNLKQKIYGMSSTKLVFYSVLIGVVGGLAAQFFSECVHLANKYLLSGLAGYSAPGLPREGGVLRETFGQYGRWLIPAVTTLGGLISGWLVYTFAPEAEGHGTDGAVKAYHQNGGRIRGRVPLVKTVASAITIGSGGAAGREGPTAQITAGVGSVLAGWLGLDDRTRRLMVLAGIAAGLSAIFRSPLGAALFAIEILYSEMEFEARMLVYTVIAAVVAYAVNGAFMGWEPIFSLPESTAFHDPVHLLWYSVLGIIAGIMGAIIPTVFYRTRDFFHNLKIPVKLKPALGGLLLGLMALALPQILGGGYGWMQLAIDGKLAIGMLAILSVAKIIALSFTISSGGSGGVFAPTLFSGTMLGALVATVANTLFPNTGLSVAAFGVVGMAAFFAGAARVPIATLLMVAEMTGGYKLMVPTMLTVVLSYMIQSWLTRNAKYSTLYQAQVRNRSQSPVHHAEYLKTALKIVKGTKTKLSDDLTPINMKDLLRVGMPVTLDDNGRSVFMGVVRKASPLVGKSLKEIFQGKGHLLIMSILRAGKFLIPDGDTVLEPWDRLVVVISREEYDNYRDMIRIPYLESLHFADEQRKKMKN
ncbi:MAG: chloride channel protein [Lentisphaeria bacterium]|nr:chloride channel protein [Candidatus Neomarinimicrobiota bacterium]MCF7842600.1 chloride channel protein [Lentisphaeria bacterium]